MNVFAFEDDYSFGILQSSLHLEWTQSRCSTLAQGLRYTGDTVFSTFPWPQNSTEAQIKDISSQVDHLMKIRKETMLKNNWGLRELYNTLDIQGENPLRAASEKLDKAVRQTYGMRKNQDTLEFLLNLNIELHKKEQKGLKIIGPGLPPSVKNPKEFISKDYIDISKSCV